MEPITTFELTDSTSEQRRRMKAHGKLENLGEGFWNVSAFCTEDSEALELMLDEMCETSNLKWRLV